MWPSSLLWMLITWIFTVTEETMQDAFVDFGNKIKPGGLFISKFGLKRIKEIKASNKYQLQFAK